VIHDLPDLHNFSNARGNNRSGLIEAMSGHDPDVTGTLFS